MRSCSSGGHGGGDSDDRVRVWRGGTLVSKRSCTVSPGFVRHIEFVFGEGVCVRRVDRQTSQLSICRPINTYLTPGAKHSKHSFLECSAPMKHSAFECTKNSEHLSAFSTECSHTLKALGTQCWCDSGHSVLRTSIVCGMALEPMFMSAFVSFLTIPSVAIS